MFVRQDISHINSGHTVVELTDDELAKLKDELKAETAPISDVTVYYEDGSSQTVPEPSSELPEPNLDANLKIETVYYEDGSSATGVAPLPDHSPEGSPKVK